MSAVLKSEVVHEGGPFKPGHKKIPGSGRPVGSKNKPRGVALRLKELGVDCVEEIINLLPELKPAERVKVYLELMTYAEPKLRPQEAVQDDPGATERVSPVLVLPAWREPVYSQPAAPQPASDTPPSPPETPVTNP